MRTFLTILGGFFLVLYVLGSLNAIDFRMCVGELVQGVDCSPKAASLLGCGFFMCKFCALARSVHTNYTHEKSPPKWAFLYLLSAV